MPTLIAQRSTNWVRSGGSSHDSNEDYRAYWKIYYDTDAANNRTLITVEYYVQTWGAGGAIIWSYGSKTANSNVNGNALGSVTISYSQGTNVSNGIHLKGTKTEYVNHNSDGSASFTWNGSGAGKSTSTSTYSTANGDFPAIPQGTTVTQSIATKSESSIKVNWSTTDAADYIWYSTNNGSSYTAVGSVSGTSGNYTISGLSPNTTYTIVTRARRQSSQIDTNYSSAASVITFTKPVINSISDVTETSFKINWSSAYAYSTAQYSINNGSSWSNMPSGNVITGLSPNTQYNVKVRAQASGLPMYEAGSDTAPKTTYDYPKPTSTNNFIIDDGASVNLENPLGRNVTLQILQKGTNTLLGSYTGTANGVINAEFKTADAIQRQYASIPNNKKGYYYAKVTYNSIEKTYDINSSYSVNESINKPDLLASYFSCWDVNNSTTSLTGNASTIVNGYSTLRIDANTNPVGKNSATITQININGTPYTWSNDFTTQIASWSNPIVEIYVTDSRGILSDKVYINLSWKDYTNIVKGNSSPSRSNQGVGDAVTFTFGGTFWNDTFGSTTNTLSATYTIYNQKTQVTTVGTSPISISTLNNDYSFSDVLYGDTNNGFDVDTKYTVNITVSDSLSSVIFTYTIIEGTPAISLYGNNVGLGQKYDPNVGGRVQILGNPIDNIYLERRYADWTLYRGASGSAWYHIAQFKITGGQASYDIYGSSSAANVGWRGDFQLHINLGDIDNCIDANLIYANNYINYTSFELYKNSDNTTYDLYFYMPQWTRYNFIIYKRSDIWSTGLSITPDTTQSNPSGYEKVQIFSPNGIILWENPNPSSAFTAQTINLSTDQYDVMEWYYRNTTSEIEMVVQKCAKGYAPKLNHVYAGGAGVVCRDRGITRNSNTSFALTEGRVATGSTGRTTDNNLIIPIKIIGYRTGLF